MLLDHLTSELELEANLDGLEGGAEGLGAYELGAFREDDVQVALQHGTNVLLFEVLAKHVILHRLRVLIGLRIVGPVSIFN